MGTVTRTSDLPLSAVDACALARKPELFRYVVWPVLRVPGLRFPERLEPGVGGAGRLWWFGVVPSWTHHLTLVRLEPTEILTREHGGPVRTWNHHLTFTPTGPHSCRYTDEIEIDDGVLGFGTRVFAALLFRWRHRRWRALARVIA